MFKGIAGAVVLGILDYLYIFVVLAGLALVMVILAKIVQYSSKNTAKSEKPVQVVKKEITKKVGSPQRFNEEITKEDQLKKKAAISAAIAAYLSEFKGVTDYKIIDIKPAFARQIAPWGLSQERFPSVNLKK
ncbi:MAG: OadG family transporter subunit [Atribacterota bacterium]|jgi:uncharacterized membrane protein YraQ (UPF0718 family)|nr:OadG family transporter subunit [Atribacterota bacterium]MDD3640270.1 OadG family transporter subunit [Atribacterota bacterium]